ncbi:MAG: class II aldolase/adducin family protein [Chloroflexota bacterium]
MDAVDELRLEVAQACRVLAMMGLVKEATGHVSARIPGTNELVIRARGFDETGLLFTRPEDVIRADFDGHTTETREGVSLPQEFPIHGEIFKARPEVMCVVHAHPPAILRCGIAGVELKPIFGAFDPSAAQIAAAGIPVYPRSITVTRPALAQDMMAIMGEKEVCLMYGHGITAVGSSIGAATVRAIKMEALAEISWDVSARAPLREISDEDKEHLLGRARAATGSGPRRPEPVWKYYQQLLGYRGLAIES